MGKRSKRKRGVRVKVVEESSGEKLEEEVAIRALPVPAEADQDVREEGGGAASNPCSESQPQVSVQGGAENSANAAAFWDDKEWTSTELDSTDRQAALVMLQEEYTARHGTAPTAEQMTIFSAMLDKAGTEVGSLDGSTDGSDDSGSNEDNDDSHGDAGCDAEEEPRLVRLAGAAGVGSLHRAAQGGNRSRSIAMAGGKRTDPPPPTVASQREPVEASLPVALPHPQIQALRVGAAAAPPSEEAKSVAGAAERLWAELQAEAGAGAVQVPEGAAQLYPRARAALAGNGALLLGIDCCATCGAPVEDGPSVVECQACGRVAYCSAGCRQLDAAAHGSVCRLLQAVELDQQHQELLDQPAGVAAAATGGGRSLVCPCPRAPALGGWSDVLPAAGGVVGLLGHCPRPPGADKRP